MNKKTKCLCVGAFFLLVTLKAFGFNSTNNLSISYWDAEYKFQATDSSGNFSSPNDVWWSYPVFLSDNGRRPNRLNAWIRQESLRSLVEPDQFDDLLKLSDSKLIQVIATRFNGIARSLASVSSLAGRYLQIDLIEESIGAAHSSVGLSTLVYDLVEDKPVDLEQLFKEDSLGQLGQLASSAPGCLSPAGLTWKNARFNIHSATEMFIEQTVSPGDLCENIFKISGPKLKRLLRWPNRMSPPGVVKQISRNK
ncbi:hypothetical protein [Herbaspirillum robiniae]|uniref:hypothetical protein n=1 Tax=Herbaspirillum robiniae TaxID=2014887 RepID=UPI003D78650C